jgi:type IV fimbrial biogenesis protein FimT
MVTVAIAGIILSLAVPAFGTLMQRNRLKQAAEAISGELDAVRLESSRRDADLTVSFTTGASWCYGVHTASCDCGSDGSCSLKRVTGESIATNVTLSSATFSGNTFTSFDRVRGTAAAGNVTLTTPSNLDLRVVVSTRGRIRICSPSDNVPGYPSCS